MNELLVELGFTFTRRLQIDGTTTFTTTPPPEFTTQDKNFSSWILKLSARQLSLLVDELRHWDGNSNSNNGSLEYNSTVKDNVLWVDTAMRLCGRFSGIYGYSYKNHTTGKDAPYCWRLYERTSKYGSIDTKRHITTREFDGIVYCPKVDSDRILVRHNNKICVVNQCQNLPKRKGDKSLRRSMTAPNDHVLIATDSSQIECLTGDSLVLTDTGLKRIDNISIADLLWDGVEWVRHDGVVLKGVKDVITYAGITGTPNHIVYTADGRKLTLDEAAASGAELAVGEADGKPVQAMVDYKQSNTNDANPIQVDTQSLQDGLQRYTERGNLITGTVAVYDIINAGSRNRFCCNGIIVSNCRVLAYTAQELPLLNIFLNKDDPYSDMASNIYGLPYDVIYREAKIERTKEGIVRRNVGKTTELGCIAEGTEVLTDRGWVQIQNIQSNDLLWDGDEFVPHGGLIDKGEKECIEFSGVTMTPDHKVYDGHTWEEAKDASEVWSGYRDWETDRKSVV